MKTNYRNVFAEAGIPKEKIDARLEEIKEEFFHGKDSFYHEVGDDLGYLEDTGNFVRTKAFFFREDQVDKFKA